MITSARDGVIARSVMRHRLFARPVENSAVIREEERGSAAGLMHYHVSEIKDLDVRHRIMQLSVLEIIS